MQKKIFPQIFKKNQRLYGIPLTLKKPPTQVEIELVTTDTIAWASSP